MKGVVPVDGEGEGVPQHLRAKNSKHLTDQPEKCTYGYSYLMCYIKTFISYSRKIYIFQLDKSYINLCKILF